MCTSFIGSMEYPPPPKSLLSTYVRHCAMFNSDRKKVQQVPLTGGHLHTAFHSLEKWLTCLSHPTPFCVVPVVAYAFSFRVVFSIKHLWLKSVYDLDLDLSETSPLWPSFPFYCPTAHRATHTRTRLTHNKLVPHPRAHPLLPPCIPQGYSHFRQPLPHQVSALPQLHLRGDRSSSNFRFLSSHHSKCHPSHFSKRKAKLPYIDSLWPL